MDDTEVKPIRCLSDNFGDLQFNDEDNQTQTSIEQKEVEHSIQKCYHSFKSSLNVYSDSDVPLLERDIHTEFLRRGLKRLSSSYEALDASRPWLCFWILHSLELLDAAISEEEALSVADFLSRCQDPNGGFAGGPGQQPHLAPTYAAVNALCILGNVAEEALDVINRETLYKFLTRMKTKDGAFLMHEGGEEDIRGVYCALSSARLTNIINKELVEGTEDFIARCQTYEGGFAGYPGMEAHGGYSFCGIAALTLLGHTERCNLKSLLRWTANRQTRLEGGFQGRTNKLVDGCYSFWQGGVFPIMHMIMCTEEDDPNLSANRWLFDQEALQEYILICCQHVYGGLIDKPGKPRDYYHTCYCLSGLSVAQHVLGGNLSKEIVIGNPKNKLRATQPVYNLSLEAVMIANQHFGAMQHPMSSSSTSSS